MSLQVYSQKEAAHWFFGNNAALNFNNNQIRAYTGSLSTLEGCASISNKFGELLFYTDGKTVYNRNHDVLLNGYNLSGNKSSTQSAIIVPKPASSNIYYIFTVAHAEKFELFEYKKGLNYSVVDMNLDGGLGGVIPDQKNIHLITYNESVPEQKDWKCSEKIAATLADDQKSYWVLTHFVDTFYSFKIDEFGVQHTPVKSVLDDITPIVEYQDPGSKYANVSALGYLKISPNGKKIAMVHSSTGITRTTGKVFLYDFNNQDGTTSRKGIEILSNTYPYGVEFSPKSQKLYTSSSYYITRRGVTTFDKSRIHQFDLNDANISASKKVINESSNITAGALQLAIDGKIYRAMYNQNSGNGEGYLAAISKPELLGNASQYIQNAISLRSGTNSEYGLPPFISSTFLLTFDYEFTCLGDDTHFFIKSDDPYDNVEWDFGDGHTSTDADAYHTYNNPGVYTVTLISYYNGIASEPMTKEVEIRAPLDVFNGIYDLVECDALGDPSDGITSFNLNLANNALSLDNESSVDVYYYETLEDLNADTDHSNALQNIYNNSSIDQVIFAKIVSKVSNCFGISKVRLKTSPLQEFRVDNIVGCPVDEKNGEFNLELNQQQIIETLALNGTTVITFHEKKYEALMGLSPLNGTLISEPKEIYIRVKNDDICYGVGTLNLELHPISNVGDIETIELCESFYPYRINALSDDFNSQNYSFKWFDGITNFSREIYAPGNYVVEITSKQTGCSTTKTIQVITIERPTIQRVNIEEHLSSYNAVIINTQDSHQYKYALNNPHGPYQEQPVFNNLAPGHHTLYIQNKYNCNTTTYNFYIFGYPKFFTPNNDGQNDVWEIKGLDLNLYTYSNIQIYDRFGKLLSVIEPDGFWDGYYNGKLSPTDDYWFVITITDAEGKQKVYKDHFSLILN